MLLWVSWLSFILFFLAAVIHLGFFVFEAFLLRRPEMYKQLGYSAEEIRALQPWALQRGIYNFCLALGVFVGLYLIFKKQIMVAGALVSLSGLTMVAGGIVFWFSSKTARPWALLQVLPPLLGFVFLIIHVLERIGG